ncbi:MAG: hypothetical protein J7L14_00150 [Candidatus Diapherotrites archaeon]|nr:hypothetical protein [Candidatus Diapherotrites archaeon]
MENEGELLKLYRRLLEKYADIINEKEQKTVGEIKEMVSGEDLTIKSIAEDFKGEEFKFEKDYRDAAKKAFEFVKENVKFIEPDLQINFWLSPREILELKIADDEDTAIFLCSILKALGDDNAKVVVAELDNMKPHAFVETKIGNSYVLLDATQNHNFDDFTGETEKEVIEKFSFRGMKVKRILYKFNSSSYETFE